MTIFHRAPAGLVASGVFILGLFRAGSAVTHAAPVNSPVMLVNAKTGKCLTIAGGESTANNVDTVQFDCDSHPSRSWMLNEMSGGVYQIRNVRTGKCLTISGGVSDANNMHGAAVRLRQPSVAHLADQRRDRQRHQPDQQRADRQVRHDRRAARSPPTISPAFSSPATPTCRAAGRSG